MCVKLSWKTLQETWDQEAYCVKPRGGGEISASEIERKEKHKKRTLWLSDASCAVKLKQSDS